MTDRPLKSLTVSDFRRLSGTRRIPLDAPIVLIHGPNGTGKTSIMSALEMALTGRVGSMERQDAAYTAHLPFTGQDFATVQVDVDESLRASPMRPMTVSGARVAGEPALEREHARFFSERCFLDQASLGRLLELYELREGRQESLLAKFVNELLGLEHLDALRGGLHDATDLRTLKKLATRVADADTAAKRAAGDVAQASEGREAARREQEQAASRLAELLRMAGVQVSRPDDLDHLEDLSVSDQPDVNAALTRALGLDREIATLRGRIEAVSERPTSQRRLDAQMAVEQARARLDLWQSTRQPDLLQWAAEAHTAGIDAEPVWTNGIAAAVSVNARELAEQSRLRNELVETEAVLDVAQERLRIAEAGFAVAQEEASALVEGLASVRAVIIDDNCPVCDRNFAELGKGHLDAHLDAKLARMAKQGAALVELRRTRDRQAREVAEREGQRARLVANLLGPSETQALEDRRQVLESLSRRLSGLGDTIREGELAQVAYADAQRLLEGLAADESAYANIDSEVARLCKVLNTTISPGETPAETCSRLVALSEAAVEVLQEQDKARRDLADAARRVRNARAVYERTKTRVAEAVREKALWEGRVTEAKRRQRVARDVHDAAATARTAIVQRVFTESLNNVWADLFMRLAPSEEFIPAFGIPSSTKTTLEVALETRLRNGDVGGPPQMMLSAGNLNTAALSLFLALHLAVDPVVPCLVFDDPVQAMDEVHVAQFAALIRTLSKQHERQVVIAVHERELFDYLTLELSPAFEGDRLITVELGDRANEADGGIRQVEYAVDHAITG